MSLFTSNNLGIKHLFPNSSSSILSFNSYTPNNSMTAVNQPPSLCNNNPVLQAELGRNINQNGTYDIDFKNSVIKCEEKVKINNRIETKRWDESFQSMTCLKELNHSFEEYRLKDYSIKRIGRQYNPSIAKYKSQNTLPLNPNLKITNNDSTTTGFCWNFNSNNNSTSPFRGSNTLTTWNNSNTMINNSMFPLTSNTPSNGLFPINNSSNGLFPTNTPSNGLFSTNTSSNGLFPTNTPSNGLFVTNTPLNGLFPTNTPSINTTSNTLFHINPLLPKIINPINSPSLSTSIFPMNNNAITPGQLFPCSSTTSTPNSICNSNTPSSNPLISNNKNCGVLFPSNTPSSTTPLLFHGFNNTPLISGLTNNKNKNSASSLETTNTMNANQLSSLSSSFLSTSLFNSNMSMIKPSESNKINISNNNVSSITNGPLSPPSSPNSPSIMTSNPNKKEIPFIQASTMNPQNITFRQDHQAYGNNPQLNNGNFFNRTISFANSQMIEEAQKNKLIIQDFINEIEEINENVLNIKYHEYDYFASDQFKNKNDLKHNFIGSYIPKYKEAKMAESSRKKYYRTINEDNKNNLNRTQDIQTKPKPLYQNEPITKKKRLIDDEMEFNRNLIEIEERFTADFKLTKERKCITKISRNDTMESHLLKKPVQPSDSRDNNIASNKKALIRSISVVFKVENEEFTFTFEVNVNNEVKLLKEAFIDKFNAYFSNEIRLKSVLLMIPNQMLSEERKLMSYSFNDATSIEADITYDFINKEAELNYRMITEYGYEDKSESNGLFLVMNRTDYNISPDYPSLCKLTPDELKQVSNFKVYNDYGEIEFLDKVNILGLNLDNIIDIRPFYVSIYHTNNKQKGCIPPKGKELNVKRMFTIKQMNLSSNELNVIKDHIKKSNGTFVSYDQTSEELKFLQE